MMDAMARNRGTKNALISVSTTVLGENSSCVLNVHSTKVIRRRAGCTISGLSPQLLLSSPAWPFLLDKIYWTFSITLNFEDDLGS